MTQSESEKLKPARYSSGAVANWFIAKAMGTKKSLTHMQLQKLIYFAHGWHLAKCDGQLLVNECAEAWVYGPVFPEVYHEYKKYGSAPLPLGDRTFMMELDFSDHKNIVFRKNFVKKDDSQAIQILEKVWSEYSDKSGSVLSDMTHIDRPNNPWKKWRNEANKLRMQSIDISNNDIKSYFCELDAKKATH